MRPSIRLALALAATATMAWGCGSPNSDNSGQQGNNGDKPASTPALPSKLPTITDEASVEPALRSLITLAVTHAVGVPAEDRNPEIVTTADSACGVKIKAIACSPTEDPKGAVKAYINPTVTWQQFRQQVGHGGGDIPVQNAALGAAVQYLTFRDIQRNHPELLEATLNSSDAAFAQMAQITMCHNGQVYAGLHGIMQPEIAQTWQANNTGKLKDWFAKGYNGEC
jgi:hypothetical protein